jgi:hypothetical protein
LILTFYITKSSSSTAAKLDGPSNQIDLKWEEGQESSGASGERLGWISTPATTDASPVLNYPVASASHKNLTNDFRHQC